MNSEPDQTRQRRRIEAVQNTIIYVGVDPSDDTAEFRVEVTHAEIGSGIISNQPYAADDDYSGTATLSEDANVLLVSITQTINDSSSDQFFLSLDSGRSWKSYSSDELKIITGHLQFKQICRITG